MEACQAENDEDYFLDCMYARNSANELVLTTCMADRRGNVKIYQADELVLCTDRESGVRKRLHKDVVRGSFFENDYLFTCGEDGFLLKWFVSKERVEGAEGGERKQKERRSDDYESESDLEGLGRERMDRKVKFNKKKRISR